MAVLKASIDAAKVTLQQDDAHGYLSGLLDALGIPVSSQTLVFSKTSLQKHRISPKNPRAIYFNDDVYVAWTPDADLIEIASTDHGRFASHKQPAATWVQRDSEVSPK